MLVPHSQRVGFCRTRAERSMARAARPASVLPLLRLVFQKRAHVADLLRAELLIGNQMGEEQFGRSLEELACEVTQGTLLRGLLLDRGEITMTTPLLLVANISLALKRAQDRQDGGVSQIILQGGPDFPDQ